MTPITPGTAPDRQKSTNDQPPSVNAAITATDRPQPTQATDRAILKLTFREASRLGHNYIGNEHLLLATLDAEVENLPLSRLGLIKPDAESQLICNFEQEAEPDETLGRLVRYSRSNIESMIGELSA